MDELTPLIVTGHQPEFIHAGVWAKYIVTQRLAAALGGTAVNLVVDNDAAKTLALSIPVARGDEAELHHVSFTDQGIGRPYEFLPGLDARTIHRIREETAALMGVAYETSAMPGFFDGLRSADGADFVNQMIAGRRAVEQSFGMTLNDVRVSRVWGGPMPADWICRAREFAEAYNRALGDYRREEGVRNPDRPMPDLRTDGARIELPLWAYGPGEARQRLRVEPSGGDVRLFAENEPIGRIAVRDLQDERASADALLGGCCKVIRPRALALTLWARLLASDLFIHGIGGAKYDRITDKVIRTFYGVEPPAMACVSATLHLPLPRTPVSGEDLASAHRRVRDVRYQPDRWAAGIAEAAPLLAERKGAIARSDALREADGGRLDRTARHETFDRIRHLNAELVALRPELLPEAEAGLSLLEHRQRRDRIAGGREYFFALSPRAKLERLCAAFPTADQL